MDGAMIAALAAAIGVAQILASIVGKLVDRVAPRRHNGIFSDTDREFLRELFYRLHKDFENTREVAKQTELLAQKRNEHLAGLLRLVDSIERKRCP